MTMTLHTTRASYLRAPRNVALYDIYEINFDLSTEYGELERYDPRKVDINAVFTLPDGRVERMPAFYKQDQSPCWAVRYAPRISGSYSFQLQVRDRTGSAEVGSGQFRTSEARSRGFLQRDPANPRRLMTSDGNAFVLVGINTAWPSPINLEQHSGSRTLVSPTAYDFSQIFEIMTSYAMNTGRLWVSVYWGAHALEWAGNRWNGREGSTTELGFEQVYRGLGMYQLENAARLDRILDHAQQRDIYLMYTLLSYGDFEYNWSSNAYNRANGGPCSDPLKFETDPIAREFFRRYLRYHYARYGAYRAMGMLEYWNEADKDSVFSAHVDWHREMDAYWRSLDIYQHPTTTSHAVKDHYDEYGERYPTWHALPFLDVTNQHRYYSGANVVDLWLDELKRAGSAGGVTRPTFIAEFGLFDTEDNSEDNPSGSYYHDGVWVPFFFGEAAGSNMLWKVDGQSEGNARPSDPFWGFVPHEPSATAYRAFGSFINAELAYLRGMTFMEPAPLAGAVRVGGYRCDERAILLFRDWEATWDRPVAAGVAGLSYELPGMHPGRYILQYWNTITGAIVEQTHAASDGRLVLKLPPFQRTLAVKIHPDSQE